jgi:hypothetical protein
MHELLICIIYFLIGFIISFVGCFIIINNKYKKYKKEIKQNEFWW